MTRHFLNLADAGGDGMVAMLNDALDRKAARAGWPKGKPDADAPLAGHVLAMVFEKNSTRTRVSFDMAMRQLGSAWEQLYPAEQHRIVNLMIERVDLVTGGPKVKWREIGWKDLIEEFAPDSIGAELVEMEAP